MAREHVSNLEKEEESHIASLRDLTPMRSGPCANRDHLVAKIPNLRNQGVYACQF